MAGFLSLDELFAGSAEGISPPAAHRTPCVNLLDSLRLVPSHLHCHLAMTGGRRTWTLLPASRLAPRSFELGHPLRSTPITSASSLLPDDPPPPRTSVLSPFVFRTYRVFPWHCLESSQVPYLSPDQSHAT